MPEPEAPAREAPPTLAGALRDPTMLAAGTLAVVLAGTWIWWGLEDGAFFESVAYPGAILLMLTLTMVLLSAPLRLSIKGPHTVALGALLAFFAWTLLSLIWTPSRDIALEDGGRVLIYAASFLAGLILAGLLRHRVILAVVPFCVAGAAVATVTLIAVLGVDSSRDVIDGSGTLDYPFEYRNANAAYFAVVVLATLGAVARPGVRLPVGAAGAGLAALCAQLAILCQSRASVPALLVGIIVLIAASKDRPRLLALVLCVAGPVALATPTLLEPFSVAENGLGAEAELRSAAEVAIFAAAGSALAALAALAAIGRISAHVQLGRRGLLAIRAGVAALAVAAAVVFVTAVGDPVDWVGDQVSERFSETSEDASNRFLYTGGQNRGDFWRVNIDSVERRPLIGDGSGSFRQRYALERRSEELPLDAHSLVMETLAELGVIGLALLLTAAIAIVIAVRRSARLGPEQAALGAAALGAGAYFAAHASIDWLWSFPGLTAPVFALLGMASAPAAGAREALPAAVTRSLAGAMVALSLALTPLLISARLLSEGRSLATTDPDKARDRLEQSAALNPFADLPYLEAADIARRQGMTPAALAALTKAREREAKEWVGYALLVQALLEENPERAEAALRQARELNPREPALDELERQLRRSSR